MNNFNINKNSTQSGRSMIEMLGVLAIVGVLSVGGIAGYSKAMEKFKINKTADQISQIVTNIRTLYAQQTTYAGLNTINAIKMGVTPDELGTGTTLTNTFGGDISIHSDMYAKGDDWRSDGAFNVIYNNISKEACITLATMDWGTIESSGILGICIGGGCGYMSSMMWDSKNDDMGRWGGNHLPLPVSMAATKCNCENSECKIGWQFH